MFSNLKPITPSPPGLVGRAFSSGANILFPASSAQGRKATRIGYTGSGSKAGLAALGTKCVIELTARPTSGSIFVSTTQITAKAVIVFGGQGGGVTSSFDVFSLDGSNGFIIQEDEAGTQLGISVSAAGDVNNDGIDDVIISANGADPGGGRAAGEISFNWRQ